MGEDLFYTGEFVDTPLGIEQPRQ